MAKGPQRALPFEVDRLRGGAVVVRCLHTDAHSYYGTDEATRRFATSAIIVAQAVTMSSRTVQAASLDHKLSSR